MHRFPTLPITGNKLLRKPGIALAGASGSHPALVRLLSLAIAEQAPDLPLTIFDMTAFDRRGTGAYNGLPGECIRPEPSDAGLKQKFKTAALNIFASGGIRAFARLIALFGQTLDKRPVSVLLMCHSWGLPEQALIRAARMRGITVSQIDEGPFSLPLRGTRIPESSRASERAMLRAARLLGLFPPRDMTGALIDTVLVSAPGRHRKLVERGVAEDKLVLIPPPRFDRLAGVAEAWRAREQVGDRRQVLWLHQPFRVDGKVTKRAVDRAEAMMAEGIAQCSKDFDLTLILRMHPRSDSRERDRLVALARRAGIAVALDRNASLYDSFMDADAATGFYSSALLEALVCGMPAIAAQIDREGFRQKTEADKAGAMAVLGVTVGESSAVIAKSLATALSQGPGIPPQCLLDEEIGWLNGRGAACVAALLIDAAQTPYFDKDQSAC